jgi:hypothetical protein
MDATLIARRNYKIQTPNNADPEQIRGRFRVELSRVADACKKS